MSGFPLFSLEDACDIEERQHGGAVTLSTAGGEMSARRSRLRRVRWLPHQRIVVLKEVDLWAEDCVTEGVDVVAERLWRMHVDASRSGRAQYLAEYLALHVDSSRHYQWLLRSYGPSLRDVLLTPSLTPFTEERCKGVLRRVLLALDQLHGVSMYVHADVSLGNVLTSPSSCDDVVLGDLESVSPIGAVPSGCLGSYLFMAPERLVDGALPLAPHDDIWAFGVVCYNLLTWDVTHPWCALGTESDHSDNYWAFLDLMSKAKDVPPCQLLLQSPLSRCSNEALEFVAECVRLPQARKRPRMHRIVKVNVGGRYFQTRLSTLLRFPDTSFAKMFEGLASTSALPPTPSPPPPQPTEHEDVFVDANPDVFERVLGFLRTNRIQLPLNDECLRAELVHHLNSWDLMPHAFPASAADGAVEGEEAHLIELPDVCVVQLCDHMQHDQGVKRHAMTITYGADGFHLRKLTQMIRRDLNQQLSSTYWQCYQTNERAAFFATTKVANGAADILTTSITQQVVQHTERLGYHLATSYVTLSPDVVHTSVRMLIHNFIFRRVRLPVLEAADEASLLGDEGDEVETYQNFEPRPVGPQKVQWADSPSRPPAQDVSTDLWK